jgi:signal transduction histidine kinase
MRFDCLILLLFICASGVAQTTKLDSLEQLLPAANEKHRVEILCLLCDGYGTENRAKSRVYCQQARAAVTAGDEGSQLPMVYKRLGEIQKADGKNDSAFYFFEQYLQAAQQHGTQQQVVSAYTKIGNMYELTGKLADGTRYYLRSLALAEAIGDSAGMGNAHNSMGFIYKLQKDFELSINSFQKALAIRKSLHDRMGVAGAINNIGIVYLDQSKFLEARQQFLLASQSIDSTKQLRFFAMIYNNLGITYEDTGDHTKAFEYYMRSLRIKEQLDDKRGIASSYGNLGANFTEAHQYDKAIPYLLKSYTLSKALQSIDMTITATRNLYRCYEGKADYKEAYGYLLETSELEDSLYNLRKASLTAEMNAKYEAEKKSLENDRLKNENLLKSTQARNRFYGLLIVALVALLFIGAATFLWRRNVRKSRTNALLSQYNFQIKEVNQQLQDSIAEKNLMMNVVAHDLKSPLNKVKGLSELVKLDGDLNENQRTYIQKIDQVIEQGRKLITDLLAINQTQHVNSEKTEISLVALFQGLEQEFAPQAQAKDIDLRFAIKTYHPNFISLRDHVHRILDNLISNAIKYSPAGKRIVVSVEKMKEGLLFRVKDEGPGFAAEDLKHLYKKFHRLTAQPTGGESSNGLGLAIVKKLCEELGAEIELQSKPREGAEFIVKLPLLEVAGVEALH